MFILKDAIANRECQLWHPNTLRGFFYISSSADFFFPPLERKMMEEMRKAEWFPYEGCDTNE